MSYYNVDKSKLISEGDVETKIILPLLKTATPIGLGIDVNQIQSKNSLKKLVIDKGDKSKVYFPDYLISINSVPLVVIEAKKVGEDLIEAYREASLYAGEVNRLFKSKMNPCSLILACNGEKLVAGYWDDADPKFEIDLEDWIATSSNFSEFVDEFSFKSLTELANKYNSSLRNKIRYKNPLHLIGGKDIQNQSVTNTFGENISIQYRHLFNPNDEYEKADIVKNAYVNVKQHQSHVTPIDKLIRKKIRPAIQGSNELRDLAKPVEIVGKLNQAHLHHNKVLLLIGSVGSGKSTFTTYLKEVALEKETIENIVWISLDLNDAPVTSSEIYKWIKENIISRLRAIDNKRDHEDIRFIKHLYSKEINSLKKGVLSLISDTAKQEEILVNRILEYQSDLDLTLNCYVEKLVTDNNKHLIIVLDNCDKRNLEEQLLMFEVANWIKNEVNAIVFLPLRDTTYDNFRNEKPLDTVIKDLTFRINPPSLKDVIYERLRYAVRLSEKNPDSTYTLPNGFKVKFPAKDELFYLQSILNSLFENKFFNALITGLAGRDVRKGIEIFLDFCKSGHITEDNILAIKQKKGRYVLPDYLISTVFIRGERRYYAGSNSRIKNLFYADPNDEIPNPFTRLHILKWLDERNRTRGPSGITGFHRVSDIIKDLSIKGHSEDVIISQLIFLLNNGLIISESQNSTSFETSELISINPPGTTHLKLLSNLDYLSSCSENVWYETETVAESIAKNMIGSGQFDHLSMKSNLINAMSLSDYLQEVYKKYYKVYSKIVVEEDYYIEDELKKIDEKLSSLESTLFDIDYIPIEKGKIISGEVLNVKPYGVICRLNDSPKLGIIFKSDLPQNYRKDFRRGDEVQLIVGDYKIYHDKYNLLLQEEII